MHWVAAQTHARSLARQAASLGLILMSHERSFFLSGRPFGSACCVVTSREKSQSSKDAGPAFGDGRRRECSFDSFGFFSPEPQRKALRRCSTAHLLEFGLVFCFQNYSAHLLPASQVRLRALSAGSPKVAHQRSAQGVDSERHSRQTQRRQSEAGGEEGERDREREV